MTDNIKILDADGAEIAPETIKEVRAIAIQEAKRELAIPPEQQTVIQQMMTVAKEVDIDKLKILIELNNQMQDREAEKLYAADFVRMKAKLPKIIRLKENKQTVSKYAPLEDINTKIDKILEEHGFGTMHKPIKTSADGVEVNVRLWHTAGHYEEVPIWMPIDNKGMNGTPNKTLPHGIASAIMYARRVGQCALLNISTGDADGNQEGDVIPEEVVMLIKERIKQFEPDYTSKFLSYMKAESIEKILAKDMKRAFNAIDAKKKKFEEENKKQSKIEGENPHA